MAAHISRLKLKQVPIDEWSTKERLCLASSVLRSGDQNWVSVSRAIKAFGEPNRPNDWFSLKNCALQYAELLEKVETPKRKRGEKGEIDTPGECIVRKLTIERIDELKKLIQQEQQQHRKLQSDLDLIRSGELDGNLQEIWEEMQNRKKKDEELQALEHKKWLQERESQKQAALAIGKTKLPTKIGNLMRRNSSQSEQSEPEETVVELPSTPVPTAETPVKDVTDSQQDSTPVDPVANLPTTPKSSPVASTAPSTSPLLTSLLKSPTHAGTSPPFPRLHSAIMQPKEEASHGHPPTTPTSAIASLLNSSPSKSTPPTSWTSTMSESTPSTKPPSYSPSAGAPTLSRLLEMPLASPGKPLPPLPNVYKVEEPESVIPEVDSKPAVKPEDNVAVSENILTTAVDEPPQQSQEIEASDVCILDSEINMKEIEEAAKTVLSDGEVVDLIEQLLLDIETTPAEIPEPDPEPEKPNESEPKKDEEQNITEAAEEVEMKSEPLEVSNVEVEETVNVKEEETSNATVEVKKEPEHENDTALPIDTVEEPETAGKEEEKTETSQEEVTLVSEEVTVVESPTKTVAEPPVETKSTPTVEKPKAEVKVKTEPDTVQAPLTRKTIEAVRETRKRGTRGERSSGKTRSEDKREKSSESNEKATNVESETKTPKSVKKEKPEGRRERTRSRTEDKTQSKESSTSRSRREETRESRKRKHSADEPAIEAPPAKPEPVTAKDPPKSTRRTREKESTTSASEVDEDSKQSEKEEPATSQRSLPPDSIPSSPAQSEDQESLRDYKVWKKAIMLVWRSAANHKFANVFLHPVTEEVAPGYHSVVCRPMDLSQIKKNIENGIIKTTAEFQRDMMLMFQNAIMYNSSDHDVFHMAVEMQKEVMRHIQDFLATQLMVQTAEVPKSLRRETRELSHKRSSESQSDKAEEGNRRPQVEQETGKTKKRRSRANDD